MTEYCEVTIRWEVSETIEEDRVISHEICVWMMERLPHHGASAWGKLRDLEHGAIGIQ